MLLKNQGAVKVTAGAAGIFYMICIIAIFTAGASLIVWLGNRMMKKALATAFR